MRLPVIQQALGALVRTCIWVSPLAGFLVTVPVFWVKKKFLPFYWKLRPDAIRLGGAARRRVLIYGAVLQVSVIVCVLLYPWLLEWLFGARGLFDMIPGYSTCVLLYSAGLVLGMVIVPRLLGVPLGWPAAGDGTGAQHRTE